MVARLHATPAASARNDRSLTAFWSVRVIKANPKSKCVDGVTGRPSKAAAGGVVGSGGRPSN
jgi:hypothetical protein